jgi:putative FmdB family regulatory protein
MPTYEYECTDCGHEFETFQSITAKPIRKCPECGKRKVERLISGGAGLLFKGSGFYITDYRSDSYKAAEKKDSDASSGKKSDSKKSDSKKKSKKKRSDSKAA